MRRQKIELSAGRIAVQRARVLGPERFDWAISGPLREAAARRSPRSSRDDEVALFTFSTEAELSVPLTKISQDCRQDQFIQGGRRYKYQ